MEPGDREWICGGYRQGAQLEHLAYNLSLAKCVKIDRSCYLTACTPIGGSYGAGRHEWIVRGLQTGCSAGAFTVDIYKRKKIPSRGSIGATCI